MEHKVLKLSRIAALLQPMILVCAGIFWLFFVIIGAIEAKGDLRLLALYSLEGLALPLIIFVSIAFLNTRKLVLDKDFMEFTYFQSAPSNNMSRRSRRVKVKYTVTGIEDLRFEQNALEKLFNTGCVTFTGYAEVVFLRDYSDFYTNQVSAPYHHTFYGIRQFDKFRNDIYDHIDPAVLTIHVNQ